MASPEIRMMAVYLNKRKAGTVNQVDYKINPNRAPQHTQDGVVHSKGNIVTDITIDEVTPVGGSSVSALIKTILNQEDIECGIVVAGKLHLVTMACTSVNFKSVSESGMSNGTMILSGAIPDIEG